MYGVDLVGRFRFVRQDHAGHDDQVPIVFLSHRSARIVLPIWDFSPNRSADALFTR
jgi:hypothetical protein